MTRQLQKDITYLKIAEQIASLSYCTRKQVGCIIVDKFDNIISTGFNGTPTGMDNCCEDDNNETLWFTLHSESNAITKLAKSTVSSIDSTMYITLSPCKNCAKLILQAGIKRIIFKNKHSCQEGVDFLISQGIECIFLRDMKISENINDKINWESLTKISKTVDENLKDILICNFDKYWLRKNLNLIANNFSQEFYETILLHLKYNK